MKRAFTLLELIIVVVVIAVIAAILFPVFARKRDHGGASCQSNLKQIGLGFMQYLQDYDERFPPSRVTSTQGWADVLQPYVKSKQLFQCPQASSSPSSTAFTTDYFYNRRVSRVTQDKLIMTPLTILGGDGQDEAPSWNFWSALSPDATTNVYSPCQRHLNNMANYMFADGHVKALKPTAISSTYAKPTSRPTFAIN